MTPNDLLDGYQKLRKELGWAPWTKDSDDWWNHPSQPLTAARMREFGLDPKYAGCGTGFVEHEMRDGAIKRFGFAIPTDEALQAIASRGPVVEMGAGLGYWAYLLKERFGATVDAYDKAPVGLQTKNTYSFKNSKPYIDVRAGSHEVLLNHYSTATLLLVWPNYNDPFADDCLTAYRGDTVAYVGEGEGGCTADDTFHARLKYDWHEVQSVVIPQWSGIHDRLSIHKRGAPDDQDVPEECECSMWHAAAACLKCWRAGFTKSQKANNA